MGETKKGGGLAFLFAVLGIIAIVVFKSMLGLAFGIISLIFSIKDFKYKNPIVYISLVFAVIEIIFCIISIIISSIAVNDIISDAKMQTYERYEDMLESYAETYVMQQNKAYGNEDFILTDTIIIDNTDMNKADYCESGYVIVNQNENRYDAYVKCDNYKTDGFDEFKLQN